MTKAKATTRKKSETTIAGQLNQSIDYVHEPTAGKVERVRLSAISLEERIADRIRVYWGERGYYVDVGLCDVPQHRNAKNATAATSYRAARSNLTNGLPPGCRELKLGVDQYSKPKPKREKEKAHE